MSRPAFRVAGIPVVIDPSWLIIAVLVVWVLFAELASAENRTSLPVEALVAVGGAVAFFACLLGHELSHSVVARRRGLEVRRVRLFVFGGVSEIGQEAGTPRDELAITAAGPAASLALAGVFLAAALAVPSRAGAFDQVLELLAVVNLALAVFNLLPGFPLDGGRVLRALTWLATGSFERATVVAVAGGRVIAGLLGLAGVALLVAAGDVAGVWWLAIAWFLWVAAGRSLAQLRFDQRLAGVPVATVMTVPGAPVSADTPLGRLRGAEGGFAPVVAGGRVRGLVDLAFVAGLRPVERAGWTAGDSMLAVGPGDVVEADRLVLEVLAAAADRPLVVVREGRMVGVLSHRSVHSWLDRG